ncbi:probable inactive peptidyl-prolyl cis-trans isomerase-like 6 isoform X1 [Sarcophilus harrisii]|uniref:Probable inactive peptidyl-prolyl cis-trans isomerase-like 6 n=1 Tax=Sarcophilus harrisii TaxID=9305 RepID=G3VCG1_SARHA|nr:probable inactive peptidyl-prolyl cis-trans isomerase-like 6 isoform X1 [Sarcophilus harrisii]
MENRPPSQPWAPFSCPGLKKPPEVVLQLKVVGLFKEVPFQIAKCTAECLKHSHPDNFKDPIIVPLHEFAWQEFLREKKRELKGETWRYPSTVMCFINDQLMGNEGCLQKWAHKRWGLKDFKPIALYQALTSDYVADYLRNSKHPLVFFEVTVNKRIIGRLIFELYADVCPKTCENFRTLCTGKAGFSQSGIKLHYKNTIFHRLVKNGWLQGGDIYMGKGDGGESIYGPTFEDENFIVPHDKRGVLGMANKGRHTNGSQFYITLQKAPYLDRKYVAFGQLIEGTRVLQILEVADTTNERPIYACRITDCGNYR